MDCSNPMYAVKVGEKYRFVGAVKDASVSRKKYLFDSTGNFVILPCGQCIACRLNRSRDWATRCVLEAKMYEKNCFVTLTYDDEHLPKDLSLDKKELSAFMKRLRYNTGKKIRFYGCGEYGELYHRPHYHVCLFGYRPDDLVPWSKSFDSILYLSETISRAWQFRGFVTVGDVSFESAAYVARYVTKKITGSSADAHYGDRLPEFTNMSLKPGIGYPFFEKYSTDIYGKDFVVIRDGIKCKPSRYFDLKYDSFYGDGAFEACIKPNRLAKSVKMFNRNLNEYTFQRITSRARVKELKFKQKLKRHLEEMI